MSYDFYSPFMSAAIITDPDNQQNTRYPLWSNMPSERYLDLARDGTPLSSLAFLKDMTLELQLAFLPRISATLAPPYPEAIKFLDSQLIEFGRSILQVQFGYSTGAPSGLVLSPPFSGILLQPDVRIGVETTITLNAQGVGGFSMTRQESGKTFANKSRLDIIKEVAEGSDSKNKRRVEVDANDVTFADTESYRLLIEEKPPVCQGFITDWLFIWKLVRECQCWMLLEGSKLRIFPINTSMAAKPKYSLRLFNFKDGTIGPRNGVFPILSASSPTMAVYLPGATRGFFLQGIRSGDRKVFNEFIGDEKTNVTRTKQGSASPAPTKDMPGADKDTGAGAQFYPSGDDNNKSVAQARAAYTALANNMGVKLEIDTIGIPDILPGMVVAVYGLGKRLEGNYGVFKVNHTFGEGFTTRLELVSNTSDLGRVQYTAPRGQVNTQKPQESENNGPAASQSTVTVSSVKGD